MIVEDPNPKPKKKNPKKPQKKPRKNPKIRVRVRVRTYKDNTSGFPPSFLLVFNYFFLFNFGGHAYRHRRHDPFNHPLPYRDGTPPPGALLSVFLDFYPLAVKSALDPPRTELKPLR